jgi:hypothetical protein
MEDMEKSCGGGEGGEACLEDGWEGLGLGLGQVRKNKTILRC